MAEIVQKASLTSIWAIPVLFHEFILSSCSTSRRSLWCVMAKMGSSSMACFSAKMHPHYTYRFRKLYLVRKTPIFESVCQLPPIYLPQLRAKTFTSNIFLQSVPFHTWSQNLVLRSFTLDISYRLRIVRKSFYLWQLS